MISAENSCEGKVRYSSRKAARRVMRRLQGRGLMDRDHVTAYRCLFCDFYHIGHTPPAILQGEVSRRTYAGMEEGHLDPRWDWQEAATLAGEVTYVKGACRHLEVVPVVTGPDDEVVAHLCRTCSTQLPAEWSVS